MINILSNLMKSGRVAVVALVLGAASITAMPAMAQSGPSMSFQLGIGDRDRGLTLRFDNDGFRDRERIRVCLTNNQIRRGLRTHGFRNIDFIRNRTNNRVEIIASYGSRWYRLMVNRCTGRVQVVERIRRIFPGRGFGLQFNFGM